MFDDLASLLQELGRGRVRRAYVLVECLQRLDGAPPALVVPADRCGEALGDWVAR